MATALAAMQHSLIHRGPDGNGSYEAPSQRARLSHTRLAIIDLGPTGAQPMTSKNGRYTISFNGEIYNYQALRNELAQDGVQFVSQSDTEVILHLYSRIGSACVSKLRGMFAFVIWDELEQCAFAARDPFGIKPLYYWRDANSLALASEVRAVIASGLSSQAPCPHGLNNYFNSGTIAEPNTIISDIKMLSAGHCLHWQSGATRTETYSEPVFVPQAMPREAAIAITRKALKDSIQAHLVSDVPIGLFLSGGVDSCVLVALATQASDKPINTYSIAFTDPVWNEGDIAKRVANHFGTRHTEFLMTPEIAHPLFSKYLDVIDQPTIDGFNTFCVSHLASSQGEKVVLSGLGADELFAGYKSFTLLPKMTRLSKMLALVAPLIRLTRRAFNRLLTPRSRRIVDFMSEPGSLSTAHQSLRGTFSNTESAALTKLYRTHNDQTQTVETKLSINNNTQTPKQVDLADQISQLELTTYMRNQLLRDSDVASMASGLELRAPFVDKTLFDQLAAIPSIWRLEQGKRLLIDSVPELPDWVVNRPKQGFRFPFDEWFSDAWENPTIERKNQTRSEQLPNWIPLSPWYRRWSIVVLDDWLNRYTKPAHNEHKP